MEQNTKIKSNPPDHMRPDYMRKERRKIRERRKKKKEDAGGRAGWRRAGRCRAMG
jgi:muconolactone delta-isomerase